jgi:nickel and cobalt resistance protein CnrR
MKRYPLLLVAVAFIAAFAGVFAGRLLIASHPPIENRFHTLMHEELKLDASQQQRLATLEKSFAARQALYVREMREDNRQLAEAIASEKGYGPKVAQAIDKSHVAMGMLQKQTMQHLFAMRAILTKDQAARFDAAMVDALTAPER